MMKLLLMKVKVVEVKSEFATPQLFIDSTIIKIYLYLYFILIFHSQDVAAYVFCKKIADINGQFNFFECLNFKRYHCRWGGGQEFCSKDYAWSRLKVKQLQGIIGLFGQRTKKMLSQKQETKWKSFFLLAISTTRPLKQEWNHLKNSKWKRAKQIVFVAKSFPGWPWWHQVGRYSRQTEFVITQITYWKLGGRLFFFQWNHDYVIMIWSLRSSG